MLLDINGLGDQWYGRQVNTSEWEKELGDLEEGDVPLSMRRILNPTQILQYDTSIIGLDNEDEEWRQTPVFIILHIPFKITNAHSTSFLIDSIHSDQRILSRKFVLVNGGTVIYQSW